MVFRFVPSALGPAVLLGLAACGPSAGGAGVVQSGGDPSAGEVIAETHCARCHAIGAAGDSPHADAPAFRTLAQSYPVESLAEAFAEGIVVGHPDMPVFQFDRAETDDLIAYLASIQAVD